MEAFVNDSQAIGKWIYECSAINETYYNIADTLIDNDIILNKLYFLPHGKGFWIMKYWTKGKISLFGNKEYCYIIKHGKLFLYITNEFNEVIYTLIFTKEKLNENTFDYNY